MTYLINRAKTKLYDYLLMVAMLTAPDKLDNPGHLPHMQVERIRSLKSRVTDISGLLPAELAHRHMAFILRRLLPSEVTTPKEYVDGLNHLVETLVPSEYLEEICSRLELSPEGFDVASAASMLELSELSDREKWVILSMFKDPSAHLRSLAVAFSQAFKQFDEFYDELTQANQHELSLMSDEALVEDWQLVADTFTEQSDSLTRTEIVPLVFSAYSAGISVREDVLHVSLGIHLASHMRSKSGIETKQKTDFFKYLSDPTRYDMLCLLAQSNYPNKVLAEKLGVTAPNISYHLRTLLQDGLLKLDFEHDRPRYRINHDYFRQMLSALETDLGLSQDRLD